MYGVDDRGLSFGDALHSSAKAASPPVEQSLRQQHQQQRTASDATHHIQHSAAGVLHADTRVSSSQTLFHLLACVLFAWVTVNPFVHACSSLVGSMLACASIR